MSTTARQALVRITDGIHVGQSGRVVSTHGKFATVRLTSTGIEIVIARRGLRMMDETPMSTEQWRAAR